MKTHHEIYRSLNQLVPALNLIPIQKEPYVLEKHGETPLCVHISERTADFTVVNLCQYPRAPHGELVPAPDVEFILSAASKTAKPSIFIDCEQGRVELTEQFRREKPQVAQGLDASIFNWLIKLERQGFKPEKPLNLGSGRE
ncbi:MAG: hypothetical protein ACK4Q5_05330 [Saprospiraceae bacterium]